MFIGCNVQVAIDVIFFRSSERFLREPGPASMQQPSPNECFSSELELEGSQTPFGRGETLVSREAYANPVNMAIYGYIC